MITESKQNGINRHDMDTIAPNRSRTAIEETGYVLNMMWEGDVTRYLIDFNGVPIEARVSPARVVLFSPSKTALTEFEKLLQMEEWEYSTVNKNDYAKR